MSMNKIVTIGERTHVDLTAADVATEDEPTYAVPTQGRADKQKDGLVSQDVSGGTEWTVSDVDALNKVLRPTGQDASYNIVVPDNGLWLVDTTDGTDGSTNDATVKDGSGSSSVTVNDGHGAFILANGGTISKLDVSG